MGAVNDAVNPGLDQLEAHAINADLEREQEQTPPLPAGDQAQSTVDYQKAGAMFTDMVVNMICAFEPQCAQYWPEQVRSAVAKAAGDVCEKYQVTGEFMGPEIVLLMLAGPPLYQCSKLIAESMNNPPPSSTQGQVSVPAIPGTAATNEAMIIPGPESGTATHSQAMMDLKP